MTEPNQQAIEQQNGHPELLERIFKISERGSTVQTEVIAGITSFLASAYLVVLIPDLLSKAGIEHGPVITATIIVFVCSTLFMALYANLPFLTGPGIGGSALIGTMMIGNQHVPWQIAIGIAGLSGMLFLVLTILGMREVITRTIPVQIKIALGASIGIFIAIIGFKNAGLLAVNAGRQSLMLGNFTSPNAIVALCGLVIGIGLQARRIPGAILWAIIAAMLIGIPLKVTHIPDSLFGYPLSIAPVSLKVDVLGALDLKYFPFLFAFFAAEFFSTMGTTLAVGGKAGLVDEHGNMENINRPFVVDSSCAMLGPLIGVPAATALVESAAGVEAGGKTGLTAASGAVLFLLMFLFTPLVTAVPAAATAPALIMVGASMLSAIRNVDFSKYTDGIAVLFMVLLTLVANSFGTGIAGGLLFYVVIKVAAGEHREVPVGMYIMSVPLVYYFWTLAAGAGH